MRSCLVALSVVLVLALVASPVQVQAKRGKPTLDQEGKSSKGSSAPSKATKNDRKQDRSKKRPKKKADKKQKRKSRKNNQEKANDGEEDRAPTGLREMRLKARQLEARRQRRLRNRDKKTKKAQSGDPSPEDSAADSTDTEPDSGDTDVSDEKPEGSESDEPTLPEGFESDADEPDLPPGLGGESDNASDQLGFEAQTTNEEPSLGLEDSSYEPLLPFEWTAFLDLRAGTRVVDDPNQYRRSMDEVRLQLHGHKDWDVMSARAFVTADFLIDRVADEHKPELETGRGAVDLREAHFVVSPLERIDFKVGRQVLTWGTGDLLFINDLFPKDWNALLLGRELSYLKAPSDAVRMALFTSLANFDVVYTPRFDADRYPDRNRVSSWDPLQQKLVGQETPLVIEQPDSVFEDDEWAGRMHRRIGLAEVSAYYYRGYWKSPAGINPVTGAFTFPKLSVYGASIRRPMFGGIAHTEGGYYDSRLDRDGLNPFVRNSEVRALVGFEREARANLTVSFQYYVEHMQHHGLYERTLPPGFAAAEKNRHVGTMRVRYLAMQQNLLLSFFGFASPNDRDVALFPSMTYSIGDEWKATLGANIFWGKRDHTFFGQLENNTNAFLGLRASWL